MNTPAPLQTCSKLLLIASVLSMLTAPAGAQIVLNKSELPVLSKSGKSAKSSSAQVVGTGKSNTLYWYDGKLKRSLASTADQVAYFGSKADPKSQPEIHDQTGQDAKTPGSEGVSPLFLDANSGRLTGALPGGVVVRTNTPVDFTEAESLADSFGSSVVNPVGASTGKSATAKDARYQLWVFSAQAGTASLELANTIHESGLVESAAPNWWKPRTLK